MNFRLAGFSIFLLLSCIRISAQQSAQIIGTVNDSLGEPLYSVTVAIANLNKATLTDVDGKFKIEVPSETDVLLNISHLGYKTFSSHYILTTNEVKNISIQLTSDTELIDNVIIYAHSDRENTLVPINLKSFDQLPNASGNIETLLKSNANVVSNSELTSQYSVRGGSYDENLIYVNDVEIYRPLLVQSAQQEGLSFINPSMVSSIQFSAGGFDAQYGDKLSSVLDIRYRQPTDFKGSASASLMGGSVQIEGISNDKKFTHNTGFRYKNTKYLLTSLDTKGDYQPSFTDLQTYLTYALKPNWQISFLGNFASNKFVVIPTYRDTEFGSFQQTLNFRAYYEGQERDRFTNYLGALGLQYRPNENVSLKLIGSAFNSNEEINYDVLSEYVIGQATQGSTGKKDSIVEIGTGGSLIHARDKLHATIYSLEHKGSYFNSKGNLKWGVRGQQEYINDQINEWELLDSAGFSLPYSNNEVKLFSVTKAHNILSSYRFSAYAQQTFNLTNNNQNLLLTLGARAQYWTINKEITISPRANLSYQRNKSANFTWYFATGLYYQPPYYKELKDPEGKLNTNIKAQRAMHWIVGVDYKFEFWDRPFIFTSELYYKNLTHLVPYKLYDVELQYLPEYKAKGFATGIDFKIYGEFVEGVESWFSLSLLSTKEDIYNDSYKKSDGTVVYPGYYRRPTDQLINFTLFFQDYLPSNPNYKLFLMMIYGSGLPNSGPLTSRPADVYKLGPYRRIDVGFSRIIINKNHKTSGIKSVWISLEVLNLIDSNNKVSYDWVPTVESDYGIQAYFAVPNTLTGRAFNGKITVNF